MRNRAVRLNSWTRLAWKLHRWLYSISGGRFASSLSGWRVILLRTIGRKSGSPREVALNCMLDNGRYVVIASYAGESRHPAWYLNLQANRRAQVLVNGKWINVAAQDAAPDERARLWSGVVARDPSYAEYQLRTSRQIPVVILTPQA